MTLDSADVSAFLHVAELGSFTRAGQAMGTTQAAVSVRLKRLETQLDRRLVQRHPRLVRLTGDGERFLPAARALLAAHRQAVEAFTEARERIAIGISEQAVGAEIPAILRRLAERSPEMTPEIRIDTSHALNAAYERGDLAAAVIRDAGSERMGEVLARDACGWFAAGEWRPPQEGTLPLIGLSEECGLRVQAVRALDQAGIRHRTSFIGGGMAAVLAAVSGGLGVSPLASRIAPAGARDVGPELGLPPLGRSAVLLRSQAETPRSRAFVRELAAAFRRPGAPRGGGPQLLG